MLPELRSGSVWAGAGRCALSVSGGVTVYCCLAVIILAFLRPAGLNTFRSSKASATSSFGHGWLNPMMSSKGGDPLSAWAANRPDMMAASTQPSLNPQLIQSPAMVRLS